MWMACLGQFRTASSTAPAAPRPTVGSTTRTGGESSSSSNTSGANPMQKALLSQVSGVDDHPEHGNPSIG